MLQPRIWIVPNFFQGVCELVHTGAVNLSIAPQQLPRARPPRVRKQLTRNNADGTRA